MSIQSEINRIEQNVADTYSVLAEAGAPMPASMDSNNLAGTAANIAAVLFNKAQSLTPAQQKQARDNIGVKSAYEIAQEAGYTGTEEQFAAKLAIPFLTPQMFGAVANDSNNDTQAINDAISALGNGETLFFPDGTYNVSQAATYEAINITDKNNINIVLSEKAEIKLIPTTSDSYRIFYLKNCQNVTIKGGSLIGDNETHEPTYKDDGTITGEQGYGIRVEDGSNINIKNIDISQIYGDPIALSTANTPATGSTNVEITNCKLHDSVRNGITVTCCQGLQIVGCEIYNMSGGLPMSGIDIEAERTGAVDDNIVIKNCYFHGNEKNDIVIAASGTVDNIIVDSCICETGISSSKTTAPQNIVVQNCYIANSVFHGEKVINCKIESCGLYAVSGEYENCTIDFIYCSYLNPDLIFNFYNCCIKRTGFVNATTVNARYYNCTFALAGAAVSYFQGTQELYNCTLLITEDYTGTTPPVTGGGESNFSMYNCTIIAKATQTVYGIFSAGYDSIKLVNTEINLPSNFNNLFSQDSTTIYTLINCIIIGKSNIGSVPSNYTQIGTRFNESKINISEFNNDENYMSSNDYSNEVWTFELEDGTTVTKEVVLA